MSRPAAERLWDVAIELDDTTAIAPVAGVLAQAGVNISSVCCIGGSAKVTCHLLVDEASPASAALAAAGVAARSRPVAVFRLQNRLGTLAAVGGALNTAGVVVDLIYQATDRGVVIGADDLDALTAAVAASGRLGAAPNPAGRSRSG
jgi:hypothetical protein